MVTQIRIEKRRDGYVAQVYMGGHPLNVLSHFYFEGTPKRRIFHYNSTSNSVLEHVIGRKEEKACTKRDARRHCLKKITLSTSNLIEKLNTSGSEVEFVPLK